MLIKLVIILSDYFELKNVGMLIQFEFRVYDYVGMLIQFGLLF